MAFHASDECLKTLRVARVELIAQSLWDDHELGNASVGVVSSDTPAPVLTVTGANVGPFPPLALYGPLWRYVNDAHTLAVCMVLKETVRSLEDALAYVFVYVDTANVGGGKTADAKAVTIVLDDTIALRTATAPSLFEYIRDAKTPNGELSELDEPGLHERLIDDYFARLPRRRMGEAYN